MKEIKIKTLTQMLTEAPMKLTKPERYTLLAALISGLAAHLYQYTNKLYNYDDLFTNPGGFGTGVEYGRWFLQLMGEWMNEFLGNYSIPLFNGLFGLVLLTVCAVMMTRLFDVKDLALAAFIGILFVTIPSVVCMNFFMFTLVYYAIGIFFSFLAGYLIVRYGKNIPLQILAVLLLGCAVGTYQAYFVNTLCILVLSVVMLAAFSGTEVTAKHIFLTSVRYVVSLISGMACYFICMKLSLLHWDVALGGYQGIENMGKLNPEAIPQMLYDCYHSFFWFPRTDIFYENPTVLVKGAILLMYLVAAVLSVYALIRLRRQTGKLVLLLLSMAAFPVAVFFIYVMVPDGYIYPLMTYSVVFIYLFILVLLDKSMQTEASGLWYQRLTGQVMHWVVSLSAILIAVIYIWNANGNYLSLWYTQQHDIAYFQTMLTQIRSAEGYRDGLPFAIIGRNAEIKDSAHTTGSLIGAEFNLPGKLESNINGYSRWHILIQYLGYNPTFLFDDKTSEIAKWEEVQAMPCYPADGSIQIINDVVVLKLSDEIQ